MIESLQDAVAVLKAAGLAVSVVTRFNSLQIGSSLDEVGEGLHIFRDGCGLNSRNSEWVVLFPSCGLQQYHVPGTLAEGVALILAAYQDHRTNGGEFHEACKRVLKDADQYLTGRSLAGV
jgi:hypothetical protein